MLLIGNSYPFSLIRHRVVVEPRSSAALSARIQNGEPVFSFWGHENTLHAAEAMLGCDLKPTVARPVISLSADGYPSFQNVVFKECWILSPNYTEDFRPQFGEEVPLEKIRSWQVLHLEWQPQN